MSGIQINTGFNPNKIDFNETFSNSLKAANENFENSQSFVDVFNSKNPQATEQIDKIFDTNIGMDAISRQKIENISETEKMARDIQKGLSNSIISVNNQAKEAERAFETFASGGDISVHDVMIAAEKSSSAMQMTIQLRNQMLNAYNELKNISI